MGRWPAKRRSSAGGGEPRPAARVSSASSRQSLGVGRRSSASWACRPRCPTFPMPACGRASKDSARGALSPCRHQKGGADVDAPLHDPPGHNRDCLRLRPLFQPVLERGFESGSPFAARSQGSTAKLFWMQDAQCWRNGRSPSASWASSCTSAGPTSPPNRSPTPFAIWSRSSSSRRGEPWGGPRPGQDDHGRGLARTSSGPGLLAR